MLTGKTAALAVLVAACGTYAGIGIQAEAGGWNSSDALMTAGPDMSQARVGVRVGGRGMTAYDFLLAFGMLSEVPYDNSINQSGSERRFCFGAAVGLAAKIHSGEKTELSFLGRYGIFFYQDGDRYLDASSAYQFDYYTMLFHTVFLGLEPCFKLGGNMEVFSNFGLSVQIHPNSKKLNQPGGAGTPATWQQMKDETTGIGFSGITLGFRYNL